MASTPLSSADTNAANTALTPLPAGERLFGWRDHAALWLSLGVGLLVMQIGAYLVPALGTQAALTVIVCGSVLGAGLLGWTAKIGCDSGLSSAGLRRSARTDRCCLRNFRASLPGRSLGRYPRSGSWSGGRFPPVAESPPGRHPVPKDCRW